jgi:hypothetical protein
MKVIFLFLLLIAITGGHIVRSGVFPVFFGLYLISGCFKDEAVLLPSPELKLSYS